MSGRGLRLLVAALVACALAPAAAAAPPGHPGAGKTMLGVIGDPAEFDRLTGRKHRLRVIFGAFRGDVSTLLSRERAAGRVPVLSLSTPGATGALARGAEDAWLAGLSRQLNEHGGPVWVRPFPEMNGHWNAWCAFDASGRPRGKDRSAAEFRRAFRRVAIVLRGGDVDARLRAAGLPPLRAGVGGPLPRSGQVALLWNPQGRGSPNVRGNQPHDYWPGPGFVDYVGNDLYAIRGRAWWPGMDALYERYRKPFVVGEWAPWGYDDPAFAERVFAWVARHPRTVAIVYFDRGWSGGVGTFRLAAKPRTLAVYRRAAKQARYG